jgi:hypothetical protein
MAGAHYDNARVRTMLGNVVVVSRRRRLRLLGQDGSEDFFAGATASPISSPVSPGIVAAPDLGTPTFAPIPYEPSAGPSLPPSFFAPSVPIMPAKVAQPAPVAPQLAPSFASIPGVQIVFPSQGAIATSRPVAAASFFDQQLITGVPNSYLLAGVAAIVAFATLRSSGKKRR